MGFVLAKLLTAAVLPLGATCLLLVAGVVAVLAGWRRSAVAFLLSALVWLWIFSAPVTADAIAASLEGQHPPVPVEALPRAGAIVLLGGGVGSVEPPRLWPDLGGAADRVLHAARLHRAGKAPWVVASGGRMPWQSYGTEADALADLLVEWGVPAEAIVREDGSRNTRENAERTAALLRERGIGTILLVTSALHMPRALAAFETVGLEVHPAATDYEVTAPPTGLPLRWLPSAGALERSSRAVREILGGWIYRWRAEAGPSRRAAS